jgi:hypothetical protein
VISYDRNTKFNPDIKIIDLFSPKIMVNKIYGAKKIALPSLPTYAIAIILSSKKMIFTSFRIVRFSQSKTRLTPHQVYQ